ncbi:hypothetical protein GCM10009104_03230 [Marinobacterium maritimum]|uniref:Uncharacterized protein n=1 Tax=Marinobacterium maritimum TaxID=500162 RepID=A0ABN1I1S0_9GAMM
MKAAIIGLTLSLLATPVVAQKPEWAGQPKEAKEAYKGKADTRETRESDRREVRERDERSDRDEDRFLPLSERERRLLRDLVLEEHYGYHPEGGKHKSLPPGLQKKLARGGELPPGWQDKVRRGEVLDADLYRHGERLPHRYLEQLGHGSEAVELIVLGDRIVRVAEGRGTVLDVVELTDKALEVLGN